MKNTSILQTVAILILLLSSPLQSAQAANITGYVDYANLYRLDVGVSGEVKSVNVKEGSRVIQGTLMLQLDDTVMAAEVDAAAAQKEYLLAQMKENQRAFERDNNLFDEGSLSLVELDQRRLELLKSTASYRQGLAEFERQRYRLNSSRITAPISGLVLRRNSNPGDRIVIENRTEPAFVFASDTKVIKADVSLSSTPLPTLGDPVSISFADGTAAQGKLEAIEVATGQNRLRLTITSSHSLPAVGLAVDISYQ